MSAKIAEYNGKLTAHTYTHTEKLGKNMFRLKWRLNIHEMTESVFDNLLSDYIRKTREFNADAGDTGTIAISEQICLRVLAHWRIYGEEIRWSLFGASTHYEERRKLILLENGFSSCARWRNDRLLNQISLIIYTHSSLLVWLTPAHLMGSLFSDSCRALLIDFKTLVIRPRFALCQILEGTSLIESY